MWIRKETGGNSIRWQGTEYTWPAEDPLCEVPDELGRELLAIPGGGCTEAGPPEASEPAEGEEDETAKSVRKPRKSATEPD